MHRHKNSQKRIYKQDGTYFITFVTKDRYPCFAPEDRSHEILCELFIEELIIAKIIKKFDLYAFTIMYDHVHLLIKPCEEFDISKCIKSIKENFSRDVNKLIGANGDVDRFIEGETSYHSEGERSYHSEGETSTSRLLLSYYYANLISPIE